MTSRINSFTCSDPPGGAGRRRASAEDAARGDPAPRAEASAGFDVRLHDARQHRPPNPAHSSMSASVICGLHGGRRTPARACR